MRKANKKKIKERKKQWDKKQGVGGGVLERTAQINEAISCDFFPVFTISDKKIASTF